MPGIGAEGWVLTMTVSVLTMTLGNVLGLWQSHVRRLLAYSSIAHAGYLLIGLTVAFDAGGASSGGSAVGLDGVAAALFYVLVYSVATLGAFAALACGASRERPLETLDDLAGLGRTQPALAAALALFMFSLAGLPPLAGFWGKFALVAGALAVDDAGRQPWFLALAIITVVNAVISAGYYLRVVAAMYFRAPQQSASVTLRLGPALASYACAVLVLALGLYPRPAIEQARWAAAGGRDALRQAASATGAVGLPRPDRVATGRELRLGRPHGSLRQNSNAN
jgi:NADH-quinone oxidoreductase subunit N